MSRKSMRRNVLNASKAVVVAFAFFLVGADAFAQIPAGASSGETGAVAADALVCWWKTDKSSVRIGEEFTVTLTCRLAETGLEKTVLNESFLDPGAIALSPYQVKGGTRYKEISRILPGPDGPVTLRNVQYAYTVKLMGEGFFGKDMPLPPLEIRYHIDLMTNKDTVAPGKERTYVLPPLPMRIQSLVPNTASAVRDAGNETFGAVEYRRMNAIIAFIVAGIFLFLPPVVMLPALVRAIRGRRKSASNGTVFGTRDLLRRLARELGRLAKHCRTASWDDASVGTALSVFRVGGALAVGRRVIQTSVTLETLSYEGQLKFCKGFWPRTKVLVSASLTPEAMARELAGANRQGAAAARRMALLDDTQRAFAVLNGARYAPAGNPADREALDGSLEMGLRLLRELRQDRFPFVRAVRAAGEGYARWRR